MSVHLYTLLRDAEFKGWRLQRCGSTYAESVFSSKEQALRLLPEAVERGGTISIHGEDGRVEATMTIP